MWAKLISHTLIDRPDWGIVKEDVPLGKLYRVLTHPVHGIVYRTAELHNLETGEKREVEVYTLYDGESPVGCMPVGLFELIDDRVIN